MINNTKSQLAKLLAQENIIVEQKRVSTASFDVKQRKLIIPNLADNMSNDLYDLMCGHEVGHALYTPIEGWHDSIVDLHIPKSIVNVVEDARIEKLIKRKYPGLRKPFVNGYKELSDRDFFQIKDVDIQSLNLIDRLNLYFKLGSSLIINFTPKEKKIVTEMENLETWDDVLVVCEKIVKIMKEKTKENKTQYTPIETYGDYTEEDDFIVEDDFIEEDDFITEDDIGDEIDEDEIKSHTDESFREREHELLDEKNKNNVYANIPKCNLHKIIVPYKEIVNHVKDFNEKNNVNSFSKFRKNSNAIVSYLVKEFELRKNAQQLKKATNAKSGDLDMNKIHNYKFADDIFLRVTNIPDGKSHGLVMFIDWSGSMISYLHETIKQLLNLVLFCRKVNIPFEVYAFTSNWRINSNKYEGTKFTVEVDDLKPYNVFNLLNLFSSKMKASEMSAIANCLLNINRLNHPEGMELGSTPLNETVISAMEIIPKFKNENKLQIVNTVFLTDGYGHIISDVLRLVKGNSGTNYEMCVSEFGTGTLELNTKNYILCHKKTKITKKMIYSNYHNCKYNFTATLLEILKEVTDCNIIGFYIANSRAAREFINYNVNKNNKTHDDMMKEYNKNKSFAINICGYDELFLMKSNVDVDEITEIDPKSTTTRGLVSAFTKYNNTRFVNRVLLDKFIGLVS